MNKKLTNDYKYLFALKDLKNEDKSLCDKVKLYIDFFYYISFGYFTNYKKHEIYLRTTKRYIELDLD